jgi:hypothetical protein
MMMTTAMAIMLLMLMLVMFDGTKETGDGCVTAMTVAVVR